MVDVLAAGEFSDTHDANDNVAPDFLAAEAVTEFDFDSPDHIELDASEYESREIEANALSGKDDGLERIEKRSEASFGEAEDIDFDLFGSESPSNETEYLVGRIWAERLDWFYAEECGYSVASVCDARSGTWNQVLETISKNAGQSLRKDLDLTEFVSEVIFIHESLIHPEIKDRLAILSAAIRGMSSDNSLVLMYHEQSEPYHLEDWECHELGFKKIARSNLLIRDNHFRYPFGDSYTAGRQIKFTATAEHEAWLIEQWQAVMLDHPSR